MKALLVTFAVLASAATAVYAAEESPATSTPGAVPAPVAAPVSKKDPNGRVCKTQPVIGSRVPTRICMTRAEWDQRARDAKEQIGDSQRGGLTTCATNPCGG